MGHLDHFTHYIVISHLQSRFQDVFTVAKAMSTRVSKTSKKNPNGCPHGRSQLRVIKSFPVLDCFTPLESAFRSSELAILRNEAI